MAWPRLALAASLPVLLAVLATAGEPPPERASSVAVLWVETGIVPSAVRNVMTHEAADILGPVGVRLLWRVGPPDTESTDEELRVVALSPAGRRTGSGRVLGATSTGDGPRTIWIDYANVAWAAGTTAESLVSAGFRERRRAGVALGRVLAHEVVHALVPDLPHARAGVMGEQLRDTLDAPVLLDLRTREAVRAASARSRPPTGDATASAR